MVVNKAFRTVRRSSCVAENTPALKHLDQLDKVLYMSLIDLIAITLGLDEIELAIVPNFAVNTAITGVAFVALDLEATPFKDFE